jgi:hypothetical protein
MKNYLISPDQLKRIVDQQMVNESNEEGSYMAKQQLFTIATLAYKMWEMMEEGEQLDDWMESKIAQSESSILSVVKSYMYEDVKDKQKGMDTLNYDDLIIGN